MIADFYLGAIIGAALAIIVVMMIDFARGKNE